MTAQHFATHSKIAAKESAAAGTDFHQILQEVQQGGGKLLVSCSDIAVIDPERKDGADKDAGITRKHISLVNVIRGIEDPHFGWSPDKDAQAVGIEQVRAGLRAIALSAVLQDHPIQSRNKNAILHAVEAHAHLLMDYNGVRFVHKTSPMAKMITEELARMQVIAEQATHNGYPREKVADTARMLMDIPKSQKSPTRQAEAEVSEALTL